MTQKIALSVLANKNFSGTSTALAQVRQEVMFRDKIADERNSGIKAVKLFFNK